LDTMDAVVDPATARLDELAGRNRRGMPQHRDHVALAARLDAQHAKSVLLIMECDPLDEAGQDLRGRAGRCSLKHGHPGNVRKCTAWTSRICSQAPAPTTGSTIRSRDAPR